MNYWTEKLPDKCPPEEAFDPDGLTFYRFAITNPPTENDFQSQRQLNPFTNYPNISECTVRSLSIWDDLEKCLNLLKLPRHKNKPKIVMQLNLVTGDGLVLQTFKPNHFSWWRSINYDVNSTTII